MGDRRPAVAARAASLVGRAGRTIPDRACFAAIVYMARTSTRWRLLPARELGCGSYTIVRRRLDQWLATGVFERLHGDILDRLGMAGAVDWTGPAWIP